MAWIIVAALYMIGLIGLHAIARDANQGPIKSWRAKVNLLFWPFVVPCAAIGDLYDYLRER